MKRPILAAALAMLLLAPLKADDKQARVLMQAAEAKATVEGDLKAAITLYQNVVKQAGPDRALAAQALLRMAEAHQKLGSAEAQQIYQRLVRDYADQAEASGVARSRLAARVMPAATGPTSRQVWTIPCVCDVFGDVSPDGRFVPYIDYSVGGGLVLHDLVTGTDRRLTEPKTDVGAVAVIDLTGTYSFSHDGRRLAYHWRKSNRGELRVVSLEGSGVPANHVLFASPEIRVIEAHGWSPDGKWIAVAIRRLDRSAQLGLVSTDDGRLRVLKSVDWQLPAHMLFSPDGHYLAFDLLDDVFVLATDLSREIPAVVHPATERLVGWSPDGTRLLFSSDRTGSTDLWAQRFADGRTQGEPELLKRGIGGDSENMVTVGVTASGALYSVVYNGRNTDILQTTVDLDRGRFLSPAEPAARTFAGANNSPAWSPDGKFLAFLTHFNRSLTIRSLATGEERQLPLLRTMSYALPVYDWGADSKSLIMSGTNAKGKDGIFRMDAQTGAVVLLAARDPDDGGRRLTQAVESPDGKFLYYRYFHADLATPDFYTLVKQDLATGKTEELLRRRNIAGVSLSPDGRYVAVAASTDGPDNSVAIVFVPTAGGDASEVIRGTGGDPREVLRGNAPVATQVWASDSRSLLVRRGNDVWRVSLEGEATLLEMKMEAGWGRLTVHPDGRHAVFQVNKPQKPTEVWVLENFMGNHAGSK